MKLIDAHNLIIKIERVKRYRELESNDINLWPLVRRCLWVILTSPPLQKKPRLKHFSEYFKTIIKYFYVRLLLKSNLVPNIPVKTTDLIISRPVYLKKLFNGKFFDVIADPIIHVCSEKKNIQKIYIGLKPHFKKLAFDGNFVLLPTAKNYTYSTDLTKKLKEIAKYATIDETYFCNEFYTSLNSFQNSFHWMNNQIKQFKNLDRIFIVGWYSPEAMGITAATRSINKTVIDLQHGKQGKYQSMYSGWNYISNNKNYLMLPDYFWTWGEKSKLHILDSSPKRKHHLPFVGGMPWVDYYRKLVLPYSKIKARSENKSTILVTLQNREGLNLEPIPDFLLEFLIDQPKNLFFLFRCHPNDTRGKSYCQKRLGLVKKEIFKIIDGNTDLYKNFLETDLHITAYSSCCYEASLFGVKTLLFGKDSKIMYSEEIKEGEFDWIKNDKEKLSRWIENQLIKKRTKIHDIKPSSYIFSSLSVASKILDNK